jgi:hypothetical protein
MIAFSFVFLIYIVVAGFGLWLAWQFVQAFISIARSLEDIGTRYRVPEQGAFVLRLDHDLS